MSLTIEEKLEHFQDVCMTNARECSVRMLDDYMNTLETAFGEYAANAGERADMQVEAETEELEREINKRLSIGQLDLKREISHKQEELKDKLFVELRDKLANFMEAQDYQRLPDRQIKAAREFVGDKELTIYMNPSDAGKLQCIAMHYNAIIKVSEYSSNRDTRAVLPGKHILVDSSFQAKLDGTHHEFKLGLVGGGQSG